MSRRRILSVLVLGVAAFLFYRWRFLFSQLWGRPHGVPVDPPAAPKAASGGGRAKVLLVSGATVAERFDAAWRELQGWAPGGLRGKPMLDDVAVWKERQIRRAVELGLGAKGAEEVDVDVRHLAPPAAALATRLEKALALYRAS